MKLQWQSTQKFTRDKKIGPQRKLLCFLWGPIFFVQFLGALFCNSPFFILAQNTGKTMALQKKPENLGRETLHYAKYCAITIEKYHIKS